MNLLTLVSRFGEREAARRLGISLSTLAKWRRARKPTSEAGRERLRQVAARLRRAAAVATAERRRREERRLIREAKEAEAYARRLEAAERRRERRRARAVEAALQEIPVPPEPTIELPTRVFDYLGLVQEVEPEEPEPGEPKYLPPTITQPTSLPPTPDIPGEITRIDTKNSYGMARWFTFSKPLANVDDDEIVDTALRFWLEYGFQWCSILLLLYRYIPFNPIYEGEMLKNQGTWVDWYQSSTAQAAPGGITQATRNALEGPRKANERRVIWLEALQVNTFNRRDKKK